MFGKKKESNTEDKDIKIAEKDVGFAEDSFALLKQAIGKEEHHLCDFVDTGEKRDLEGLNFSRRVRTELQDSILKTLNVQLKNQEWCELKHLCGMAMHTQELISRCSSVGLLEVATKFAECHKLLYLEYLKILGFTPDNMSSNSSA